MSVSASRQAGLEDLRAGTAAFIADDPVTVTLTRGRAISIEAPSGGYSYSSGAPATWDPQDFKIIGEFGVTDAKVQSESGIAVQRFSYTLIGMWDAQIETGDFWIDGDVRYVVGAQAINNGYEKRFLVTATGTEPNYG
jgi:hypothetical protein